MNELIILFILLGIIAFFMTIVEYFIELKQARAKSHREFLRKHPEYKLTFRGDIKRR